jgi:hypothetical protein
MGHLMKLSYTRKITTKNIPPQIKGNPDGGQHHIPVRLYLYFAVASLQLYLTGCSSTQLSPPPTFVPYEVTPGDASKVKGVVDNIRARQHSVAPPFAPSNSLWFFSPATTSAATLTITNQTECKLGFYLKGPSPRQFGIASEQSQTVYIAEGKYQFAVDTGLCPGQVRPRPLYGEDIFTAGHAYTFSLSQEDIGKVGKFVLKNDTGGTLTVEVDGTYYKVDRAPLTIDLPQGTYNATLITRCGPKTLKVELTQGGQYESRVWCVSRKGVIESEEGQE